MPIYDLFVAAITLSLITLGFTRGFIPLLIGALTWYGSMLFSILFYPESKDLVDSVLNVGSVDGYVALIVNYLIFSVALFFITQPFTSSENSLPPDNMSKAIGAITGCIIGLLVMATFELAVIKVNNNTRTSWIRTSTAHNVTGQIAKPLNEIFGDNMSRMMYDLGINKAKL